MSGAQKVPVGTNVPTESKKTDGRFKITEPKLDNVVKVFPLKDEAMVKKIYSLYRGEFSPKLKEQYLAHAMRSLEVYFRKVLKNERFIVICEPYPKSIQRFQGEALRPASSAYHNEKTTYENIKKRNHCFIIYYNPSLSKKNKRDYVAHEIGHLFLEVFSRDALDYKSKKFDFSSFKLNRKSLERLSSIFGLFLMAEKDDFYYTEAFAKEKHADWKDLLECFVQVDRKLWTGV